MNESARYASGSSIPRASDYNQIPSQIAFRGGGGYGLAGGPQGTIPKHLTYFVGTQAKQFATLWKSDYRYLVKIRDAKAGQNVQIWP